MKSIKRLVLSLSTLLLISGVALAAPVSARQAGAEDSTTTTDSHSTDSQSADDSTSTTGDSGKLLAEQFREQAKSKLEAAQSKKEEHTKAEREQSCNARKENLSKRMAKSVAQAMRHKEVMDKFYVKVKAFYADKKLNVSNYADLTAAVDKAQANAQASIDALSVLDVNVDCTSQTVAASVSAFQTAVSNTRDSLKAYRKSLVELITAIKGASTSTDKTGDTNSTTDNTNTTNQ